MYKKTQSAACNVPIHIRIVEEILQLSQPIMLKYRQKSHDITEGQQNQNQTEISNESSKSSKPFLFISSRLFVQHMLSMQCVCNDRHVGKEVITFNKLNSFPSSLCLNGTCINHVIKSAPFLLATTKAV